MAFLFVLLVGLGLLIGQRLEARPFAGLLLVGWGVFQVLDQIVFHLILKAHHIREDASNPEVYDWGFFAIGLILIVIGASILRRPTAQ